jgi:hypothetical protein
MGTGARRCSDLAACGRAVAGGARAGQRSGLGLNGAAEAGGAGAGRYACLRGSGSAVAAQPALTFGRHGDGGDMWLLYGGRRIV